MGEFFTIANLATLAILVLLQAVLGFDNLLYISIESKRVEEEKQSFVRRLGLFLAIFLRIALLFAVTQAIHYFKDPFTHLQLSTWVDAHVSVHSLIVLGGGAFIIYTALKEITHMLSVEEIDEGTGGAQRSTGSALFWIVLMNLIFSFDSILSAMALTENFWTMAVAIVISGVMMIALANKVADFLKKNRMYEVLGLFILFIVGIMLVSEGGHLAKLHLFGYEVHAMSKSTFYFVIAVLVIIDIVQGRYQKKLRAKANAERGKTAKA